MRRGRQRMRWLDGIIHTTLRWGRAPGKPSLATIAARSAVTVRSEPAHLEMACLVEPQPPLGLMKRGLTPPNSHFPFPGCAPAGFHGSNRSFVCFSRKTITEIVQGSSISFSEISCPGAPVSHLHFSPKS